MGCGASRNPTSDIVAKPERPVVQSEPEAADSPPKSITPGTSKRLFIYTSNRKDSTTSAILDKLATPEDTKFRMYEWELLGTLEQSVALRFSLETGLSTEQQVLYQKYRQHKEWLDSFSEIYVGTGMHNFGVSATLKTYFDILTIPGKTTLIVNT